MRSTRADDQPREIPAAVRDTLEIHGTINPPLSRGRRGVFGQVVDSAV